MRDFAFRGGLTLLKTPGRRRQVARRRLTVIVATLALALIAGLIGWVTAHPGGGAVRQGETGPFSYFPSA